MKTPFDSEPRLQSSFAGELRLGKPALNLAQSKTHLVNVQALV